MYTFLPGMKGATASLLLQAIDEMEQAYTRPQFVRHLTRFRSILRRSNTVSAQDKQIVEKRMDIQYDSLLDENPEIQERVARGKAEGEIHASQQMVLEVVKSRYPSLVELAEAQVTLIRQPNDLRKLVVLIFNAPDENTVRWLLNSFAG